MSQAMQQTDPASSEHFVLLRCSDKDEWRIMRNHIGVGGSSAAAVLGESPYKGTYKLWAELCGYDAPDEDESERMRWGTLLEPVVATEYAERTRRQLEDYGRFTIAQSAKWPFLYATLDRRILPNPDVNSPHGCLEVKCTDARLAEQWTEDAPVHHQIQLQTQLAVTGDSWGSIACCIGGNRLVWKDYERNEKFIGVLVDACADFVHKVRERIAPPVDGSDATRRAMLAIYGDGSGEIRPLGDEWIDVDADLEHTKIEIKKLEAKKKLLENQLIAEIGAAAIGTLPGGGRYTLSRVHVPGYDKHVDAFSYLRLARSHR